VPSPKADAAALRTFVPTLQGEIEPEQLGLTLAHEHLFILSAEFQHNYPGLWDREHGVDLAVSQLEDAYDRGVRTMVDMTVLGQGRDIGLVAEVGARTRVRLVIATGVYSLDGIPMFARFRGPGCLIDEADPLTELMLADVEHGVAGSTVRAGVVKFACEGDTPWASAERMAAAVAAVHVRTGVPVVVHSDPFAANGVELVKILQRHGVAPSRIAIAHVGDSGDLDYLRGLADTGCLLGFDRFGMVTFASDAQRLTLLATLVRDGLLDQLLVSQDHASHIDYLTVEQRARIYPEWSYTHMLDRVLPELLNMDDMPTSILDDLLVANPRRFLTPART
jgi:phosphotriesterase-related protein